jgi:hypothetical protein
MDNKSAVSKAASLMGKRGYKARVEQFGKLGGRPKGTGKKKTKATKKGGK